MNDGQEQVARASREDNGMVGGGRGDLPFLVLLAEIERLDRPAAERAPG